jgi:radical SAM protein with 4Fe4S-binding SPASM domain
MADEPDDWLSVARNSVIAESDPAVTRHLERHPEWLTAPLVPKRVTIETVFGCNAKCAMCVIDHPTERIKGVMDMDLFRRTVDALAPYRQQIEMFDLFALGEPLLDPLIFDRIRYVKDKGFRRIAISSNANLLNADKRRRLLESGIDTVIFSIDGIRKETHEAIRVRVNYDRVLANVLGIIALRDSMNFPTRFIVRFIRQDANRAEWPEYKAFWEARISPERNDMVAVYDMHSWAGRIAAKDHLWERVPEIEREPCHHVFNNLMILANGAVALCSEDMLGGSFGFGNVADADPITIYNSERFQQMRRLHLAGKKNAVGTCASCTLLYSERTRSTT